VDRVGEHWQLDVRVVAPPDAVEAPALRLDASKARAELGWKPRLQLPDALAATVFWHDRVRDGASARTVTLAQIEEAT
jgi:CDP-glucose 4,6-dehydratase